MDSRSADRRHERSYAADRRRKKFEPKDSEGAEPRVADGEDESLAEESVRTERPVPTEKTEERAILVGVGAGDPKEEDDNRELDELAELARSAGAQVLGRLYQRRAKPDAGSWLGRGKLEELKDLCVATGANLVVADTDLGPAQVRTMEEVLSLRVIDRSELIIHIFATHARTHQARLQVELAQLQYQAPRLKRMWTHLSRITGAGGIGSRGPGEKQLEVDRRLIQKRILVLREELAEIEARKSRQVATRDQAFRVGLVGYTNAGKSTLMKALTGADVLIADRLFATLDTRTRKWPLASPIPVLVSDTVGFVDKLPHHLVASFHATLEEVREASLLFHVVDASDQKAAERIRIVREVLKAIGAGEVPELLVLNKCDRLADPVEATIACKRLEADVAISATTRQGLGDLARAVELRLQDSSETLELRIPVGDGKTLALIHREGRVLSERFDAEFAWITAVVPRSLVRNLSIWQAPSSRDG